MAKDKPKIKSEDILSTIISTYFSDLAKKTHEKNPRPREFYQKMANKRHQKKSE